MVESLKHFRVYLIGIHFKVITDCTAVRATLAKRDLVPRVARWWLGVQEFDMEVEYRPGAKMQHVDALSRNPVPYGVMAAPGRTGEVIGVQLTTVSDGDWFYTVQLQDPKASRLVAELTAGRDIVDNFRVKNDRLYRRTVNGDRLYVPAMARFNLVRRHHDDIGYPGFDRCLALVKESY